MANIYTTRILAAVLIGGIVLLGGGLFASQVYGYVWEDTPETNRSFQLAQRVYWLDPDEGEGEGNVRHYVGDLLGVYAVGTKMCMLYYWENANDMRCWRKGDPVPGELVIEQDKGPVEVEPNGNLIVPNPDDPDNVESGWLRENAWGILINGMPASDIYNPGEEMVSQIYGIIPIVNGGVVSKWHLAEITGCDSALGHEWESRDSIIPNNARIGVELVLYPTNSLGLSQVTSK